jgi:3,4-dihydroxy-2-butanone 4-phosphate synthase
MTFGTIEQAIDDLRNGKLIIVADDEDRENEGDLICAAELVTPEMVNFMITHARGWVCLALHERCDQLGLQQMESQNSESMRTAFTVTIDADHRFGSPPASRPPTGPRPFTSRSILRRSLPICTVRGT